MLQVVDEFDDVVGAVRYQLEGVCQEVGLTLGGVVAVGAIALAVTVGANALLVAASIGILGTATILKAQGFVPGR